MTRNLSVWNSLRPFSVGFDSIFDEFDRMLESSERYNSNYPPYNINRVGDNDYKIEVALAGYSKDDIELEFKETLLLFETNLRKKLSMVITTVLFIKEYPLDNLKERLLYLKI
tara:strand:+ start:123 stop:461 length:339 start_codon:yes stop_codon:yes gene_type:complete